MVGALVLVTYLLWDTPLTYPIQLFVVFVHECGHAVAALLTGGEVRGLHVYRNLGGDTATVGGVPFLILCAGYLGAAAFGGLLILAAAKPRSARTTMIGLAVATAGCGIAFVRPVFGLAMFVALAAAGVFGALAARASQTVVQWTLIYVAAVSALYSVVDIKEDLLSLHGHRAATDATMLAERTFVPAIVWGLLFAVLALLILGTAVRRALR